MTIASDDAVLTEAQRHTELLLYDYFKHLTTLALVALGGVLTISQDLEQISQRAMLVVVVLISVGGGTALSGLESITKARLKGQAMPKSIKYYRLFSATTFSLGLGAYIAIFLEFFK